VLPFANMSAEKENEFLADGIHEDVITSLAKIRDLKVISRTSVLAYRDTAARNLRKIAADLGVAVVLEGSVRRSGNRVRVTAQLIDARTDEHLWAENYDGDTSDVFALQAKLAQQIAAALKATLTQSERSLIERRPTQDAQAYEFYQRAKLLKQQLKTSAVRAEYEAAIALNEQALARDPNLALAYGDLTFLHGVMYWFGGIDPTPERRARAAAALAAAQRLAPEAPETRMAQGAFAYLCENDWPKALAESRAAETGLPNDDQLQYLLAITLRRLGLLPEALGHMQRATDLNPYDARAGTTLVETLFTMRRHALLPAMAPRFLSLFPGDTQLQRYFIDAQYALDGDRSAWLRQRAAQPPLPNDPLGLNKDYLAAMRDGDLAAAERVLNDPRQTWLPTFGQVIALPVAAFRSELALLRGDQAAAKKHATEAIAVLRAGRWSPRQEPAVRVALARARVCAGEEGGVQELILAMEALVQREKFLSLTWSEAARTLAASGHNEEALDCLRRSLSGPSLDVPGEFRHDPFFAKLKSDPRFEEILKSAKPL
jgi:TolB-like protein